MTLKVFPLFCYTKTHRGVGVARKGSGRWLSEHCPFMPCFFLVFRSCSLHKRDDDATFSNIGSNIYSIEERERESSHIAVAI